VVRPRSGKPIETVELVTLFGSAWVKIIQVARRFIRPSTMAGQCARTVARSSEVGFAGADFGFGGVGSAAAFVAAGFVGVVSGGRLVGVVGAAGAGVTGFESINNLAASSSN
jgi:hypothetical protein